MARTRNAKTARDDGVGADSIHRPTFAEMLEELIDLSTGLGVALLPALLLSVPGIILFVVLPAILLLALAAPLAVIGVVIAGPPYLVARWRRRRPTAHAHGARRSVRTSGQSRVPDLGRG
jgi:hypothetical protein